MSLKKSKNVLVPARSDKYRGFHNTKRVGALKHFLAVNIPVKKSA